MVQSPTLPLLFKGELVAYRGGGQNIDYDNMDKSSCGANNQLTSENPYIENTLQSIKHAVDSGFKIIHLNVHYTRDNKFAVFHDWKVDCATDGKGKVAKMTLEELIKLDVGYNATSDQGSSFKFRDKGVKMPSLSQVFAEFPDKRYWINLKNPNQYSIPALNEFIQASNIKYKNEILYIGSSLMIETFDKISPKAQVISFNSNKQCFIDYTLYGWSEKFPDTCKNTTIIVPPDLGKYIWGWPNKFAALAQYNGSKVYAWVKHNPYLKQYDNTHNGIGLVLGDIAGFTDTKYKNKDMSDASQN
ncbi:MULTISPECIES: glycerophosphodiester phosphodiesterase family protein [unclassified Pseudoalteromonas]|uniref:glycerophosphodiester phosphodiesterase family protein n=1 Tax=unclassified Pseudoalteromonas TaxID=194690 RepID=UPI0005AB8A62|nr:MULTISPECIES: glycerophosphodiester phosphodiesterase family protein [unclassified Pseudoalteromonas]